MRKIIINIVIGSVLFLVGKPSAGQLPLDSCLVRAARNNAALKAAFADYQVALQNVQTEGSLPDPQVMFGYFIQPVETRVGPQRANFSLSQAFPWFGTLSQQRQAAALEAKAKYETFNEAKLALYERVKKAYYQLYFLRKSISLSKENLDYLQTLIQLSQTNFEAGKSQMSDVLRVQMEHDELETKWLNLKDSEAPILSQIKELLNSDKLLEIITPDSLIPDSLSLTYEALKDSLQNNPNLSKWQYQQDAANARKAVAQKSGLPSFSVGMSYIDVAPRPNVEMAGNGKDALLFPQIGIKIPIYRKKYNATVKSNELQAESAQWRREETADKLETELQKAYTDYLDARRRATLYIHQKDLASRSLQLLTNSYSADGSNFEQVIQMERQMLHYELELERARTDQEFALAAIDHLTAY